ncbi:hypothetical protein [Chengkuizengella sediminis]|uniref:hypothetical protein n=1 Tax=Chengkuizengella sediminis TaxID=1885917 RepID=UPI001389BFD6|nr:hypothetical protein [Chengkuizengella sediminis]NDI33609.1 hypothetical protein [Chengkuizengella sediminis]
MGHFDETICDCCVCPMQCVLEQLVGLNVEIFTLNGRRTGTLIDVDNFIAVLDNREFPIHNICAVSTYSPFDFKLKPIRKSVVGECSCTEDPTTKLAESKIGSFEGIRAGEFINNGTISDVGEGIVILSSGGTTAISSCKIEEFGVFA